MNNQYFYLFFDFFKLLYLGIRIKLILKYSRKHNEKLSAFSINFKISFL